jgi:DNA-binding NarL/FixJ family response regulator
MSILIVDDHSSFREAARRVLEADGFEIAGMAADGEAGIAAVHDLQPDVVLLDVQLGAGIDGFEVARRLTSNGGAPAIVITSSQDPADFAGLIEASGARGFVPKDQLSGPAIRELLD